MVALQCRMVHIEFYREIADSFVDDCLRAHVRVAVEFHETEWAIIKEICNTHLERIVTH